ncbi:hypothetical protein RB2150_17494 [Rhodobacterales bacterium HTCC2150]|nr:hypothetical protein RB2150_17494 [Rhodobacterales bacterium HTCC2150] [Rhodobacteraceae bacterium HTCC2150]
MCRTSVTKFTHLNHIKCVFYFGFALRFAHFAHFQWEGQVFGNSHVWEQGVILKNHPDAALVRWNVVDLAPIKADFAVGCGFKTCQHHQASRLA